MKKIIGLLLIIIVALLLFFLMRGEEKTHNHDALKKTSQIWTCSMHPQIRRNEPGKCPICAMDLIPASEDTEASGLDVNQIKLTQNAIKLAEIMTAQVERRKADIELRAAGKIAVDETRIKKISAWTSGRIEKLFVNFTGAPVNNGEPLALLYSPELYSAQTEFIEALKTADTQKNNQSNIFDGSAFVEASRKKLELLGMPEKLINDLQTLRKPSQFININAPISGVILMREATEGMYIETGMQLFSIADLSNVWGIFDIYESDIENLKIGQAVKITVDALKSKKISGKISFIEPVLDSMTRATKIRVELVNIDNELKPDMFVNAIINIPAEKEELLIPASAALITGKRAVVYTAEKTSDDALLFELREIELGGRAGEYYIVKSGLKAGESIVVNGAFKIDSAMQIQAKPSMLNTKGGIAPVDHSKHTLQPQTASVVKQQTTETVKKTDATLDQLLRKLIDEYLNIQTKLAADDFSAAARGFSELQKNLEKFDMSKLEHKTHNEWMTTHNRLLTIISGVNEKIAADDIRAKFAELSDEFLNIERQYSKQPYKNLFEVYCSMAFKGKGAKWLQSDTAIRNPYYGQRMLKCGELIKR